MISFHNEKLASPVLCKLLYDAVPDEYHVPVIFSYGGRHMLEGHERAMGCTNYERVWLNLEAIAFYCGRSDHRVCCSRTASVWYGMLLTGFHEFGHIAHRHWKISEPRSWDLRRRLEREADEWANDRLRAVLRWSDRLFQPNFLGVVHLVWRRSMQRQGRGNGFDRGPAVGDWSWLWDWRCHITGGQLRVGDVIQHLELADRDRPQALRHYRHVVHKLADDLARVHVDEAGRNHHFWTWGDLTVIAQRYEAYRAESEREAKWIANYDEERDREIYYEGFWSEDEAMRSYFRHQSAKREISHSKWSCLDLETR